jgi:hypothetical protein
MIQPSVYGGEIEIHAACDRYKLHIYVIIGGINEAISMVQYGENLALNAHDIYPVLLYSATTVDQGHYDLVICSEEVL